MPSPSQFYLLVHKFASMTIIQSWSKRNNLAQGRSILRTCIC
uniref:Uncharacterized protein n=1 Tax=Rhizophora mucronata TaxID=61149 RepID=A0A2P2QKY4_RHIMU